MGLDEIIWETQCLDEMRKGARTESYRTPMFKG